jgi:hypothetical protein
VVLSYWLVKHENVQVTYESQRRPRFSIRTLPLPEPAEEPVPEAVR